MPLFLGGWFVLQGDVVIRFCGGGGEGMTITYSTDNKVMAA